nr:Morn repeat domain containing protein [Pandoravirus belohorizontensis]
MARDDRSAALAGLACPGRHARGDDPRVIVGVSSPAWDLLPDELVLVALAATDAAGVAAFSATSRRHHRLANDPVLWRRVYESHFGLLRHTNFVKHAKDWKWVYRACACDARVAGVSVGCIPFIVDGAPALYRGDLIDGVPHGYGLSVVSAALYGVTARCYEGDYVGGKMHGHGVYTWPDGSSYEGGHVEDERHGHGIYKWLNGDRYEGDYAGGERHGWGVYIWANGERHEGDYVNGQMHGNGVYRRPRSERH